METPAALFHTPSQSIVSPLTLPSPRWGEEQKKVGLWQGQAPQPTPETRRALFKCLKFLTPLSHYPTPAVRLLGQTLSLSGGPCLSRASWSALPLASDPSNVAELGVNGFAYFSRKKSRSSAGAKPGNLNNQLDMVNQGAIHHKQSFKCGKTKMDSR